MSDYQEVTTAFKDPATGGSFTGTLRVAMLPPKVLLAGGGYLAGFNQAYVVTAGQAFMSDGTTELLLPITEDSNPANVPLFFTLVDGNGRQTPIGYVVIPRPAGSAPYPAIDLDDHLTV
jgi:hypothetical protein